MNNRQRRRVRVVRAKPDYTPAKRVKRERRVQDLGLEKWPRCTARGCDNEVDPRRVATAKTTLCLECGSKRASHGLRIIEVPKSNPMVVRPDADIRGLASSHKGNRQVF